MKILIVSFVDDNFGDNLIRICFERLLKVVLQNHGITEAEYVINKMPLKSIDTELIENSDVIFFAGGGLFGLSYLNFFEYLDEITSRAEEKSIPVIFSSIGINNMDAVPENEEILKSILRRRCIKSISARENISAFKKYSEGCGIDIEKVCDPAVWTKYVYGMKKQTNSGVIGINVVRGGLFKDNNKKWGMTDEFKYLYKLKCLMDDAGLNYVFYTNGSFLDNNTLRYFAAEYGIPKNQTVFAHTTKNLVETISGFSAAVTFRMHSSIIAYSFGIPTVALVWNDKIPFFYQSIKQADRALEFSDWNSETVFNKLSPLIKSVGNEDSGKDYRQNLMSLYIYLYKTVSRYVLKHEEINTRDIFDFEKITGILAESSDDIDEDLCDLRFKMEKGEKHYLARFTELKRSEKEIAEYRKKTARLEAQAAKNKKLIDMQKAELQKLNKMFIIRVIKYIKRKIGAK